MIKILMPIMMLSLFSVGLVPIQAAPNEDFGRLFSKPAERERLDKLRQNQQLKVVTTQADDPSERHPDDLPIAVSGPITMQGYVKRSDGVKNTLWINNQAVQEGGAVDNIKIGRISRKGFSSKSSTEGVDVLASGKKIRLKAGQVYEPETSQIKELQVVEKIKQLAQEGAGVMERESAP